MTTRMFRLVAIGAASGLAGTVSASSLTYLHDDGSLEGSIGPNFGDGFVALNSFVVTGGFDTITSIDVTWNSNDGNETATAAVWSDPNQDGNPSDAVLLGTSAEVAVSAGASFQTIPLTSAIDVGSNGDSFFVGVFFDGPQEEFLAVGSDSSYDGTPIVSWFVEYLGGAPADPTDLSNPRNDDRAFMIRANAIPAPGAAALIGLAGLAGARRRR